jgi:hypothetical protein
MHLIYYPQEDVTVIVIIITITTTPQQKRSRAMNKLGTKYILDSII